MIAYSKDKKNITRPQRTLAGVAGKVKERPKRTLVFNKPTKLKKPKRRSLLLGPIRSNKGGKIINKYKGGTLYVASFYD
jgi:hypothetical protein